MPGFTLVELMITIAIAAIFALIAVPSMSMMVKTNALSSYANTIFTSILLAKSEAAKRSETVTLVAASWGDGWQMKQGNTVLRVFDKIPDAYTINTTQNSLSIGFRADGSSTYTGTFNFKLKVKSDCVSGLAKNISITPIGFVSITEADCES